MPAEAEAGIQQEAPAEAGTEQEEAPVEAGTEQEVPTGTGTEQEASAQIVPLATAAPATVKKKWNLPGMPGLCRPLTCFL